MKIAWRIMILPGALALLAILGGATTRAASLTNTAGASVELLTTEADSGAVAVNTAGATVEALTTDQASADANAPLGAWLFTGLLDPYWETNAARTWSIYE